jgi:DNA repair protein RecO (recombination protein O)
MTTAPPEAEEGIVVGRFDLGERDRVLRVLSPARGRVGLVARGARGARSRWAGLDIGVGVRFVARRARDAGGLEALLQAEVRDPRVRVRGQLDALALAAYGCEIAGALAREGQAEPRLYGLLETLLLLLDALDGAPGPALRSSFEAKALTFAGVAPLFDRCARCGGALGDEALRFAPGGGGVLHRRCLRDEDGAAVACTVAWCTALEALRRAPMRDAAAGALPPGPPTALGDAIAAHLGWMPGSRAMLDALIQPLP